MHFNNRLSISTLLSGQVDIWTVISILDLKISQVEDGPHKGAKNICQNLKAIAKTYIKGDRHLKELACLWQKVPKAILY